MKVAILYVGIGRYIQFWEDFYSSCESYFLPGTEKHYFVVTDSKLLAGNNISVTAQDDLGWPCNVVFRYQFFLRIENDLRDFDYSFFFNGNTLFKQKITTEEFIPTEEDGYLIGLTWRDEDTSPDTHPYERRIESAAYIPFGTNGRYYQSGLTGGKTDIYISLLKECQRIALSDFNNGIIPVWHDESVYNKYMLNRKCKLITKEYANASQRDKQQQCKIVFRKKEDVLGRNFLRNYKKRPHTQTWFVKLCNRIFF